MEGTAAAFLFKLPGIHTLILKCTKIRLNTPPIPTLSSNTPTLPSTSPTNYMHYSSHFSSS